MSPDDRRQALIKATIEAVHAAGTEPSTRAIAQVAGVAEGTIFRVFDSKEELINAAVVSYFDSSPLMARLDEVAMDQPLRDRLLELTEVLQTQFANTFGFMEALGLTAPPPEMHGQVEKRAALVAKLEAILMPDSEQLRVEPRKVLNYLRLLTFAGSHHGITQGELLEPAEIVDVILYGVDRGCSPRPPHAPPSTGDS